MTTTPAAPVHPARRLDVEAWLTDLGATWTFDGDLPLHRIDRAASLANQVRHNPLREDVVERYAAAMLTGANFPPLIVTPTTADLYALLSGNHRHGALAQISASTFPAYVVTGTDRVLLQIRVEDNAHHGLGLTDAERLEHAIALITLGLTQKAAAAAVGLPQPKVSIAAAVADARRRAELLDVDARFHRLPQATRYQLSQISDDTVFAAAGTLVAQTGMAKADVDKVVRAVVSVDTVEALRIIGQEEADFEHQATARSGNVRRSSRTARARFEAALAEISGLDPAEIHATCPNDDVRAVVAQRIMDTAKVLHRTHDLLKPPVRAR